MFHKNIVGKIKTQTLFSIFFFEKVSFKKCKKFGRAKQATKNNIMFLRKYAFCMRDN
jgi:hypothetical protein